MAEAVGLSSSPNLKSRQRELSAVSVSCLTDGFRCPATIRSSEKSSHTRDRSHATLSRRRCSWDGEHRRLNSMPGTRHRPQRRGCALERIGPCTAPSNWRETRLLQLSAGVAVDLGAKRDFEDLRGFPAHTPLLQTEFRILSRIYPRHSNVNSGSDHLRPTQTLPKTSKVCACDDRIAKIGTWNVAMAERSATVFEIAHLSSLCIATEAVAKVGFTNHNNVICPMLRSPLRLVIRAYQGKPDRERHLPFTRAKTSVSSSAWDRRPAVDRG
ncbi:MAG TPA: hypothetical protein VHX39_17280 [Acetobacteraceae bacterium]|nr:hypothetical protein [Acetobacteraceae bacterium]